MEAKTPADSRSYLVRWIGLTDANSEADRFGIKSTPSFLLAKAGQQPIRLRSPSLGDLRSKIDSALGT